MIRPPRRRPSVIVILLLFAGAGCTNANVPLNDAQVALEARRQNHTRSAMFAGNNAFASDTASPTSQPASPFPAGASALPPPRYADGCFIGLALSGGGSRSANFAAACMFQLQRLGLMQKVDYISSVSGGSLPAAYYCLNGPDDWNPANVQKTLTQPFASDLITQTLLPWNWLAMIFSDYDRSDVLANIFHNRLFGRGGRSLTYADLRADRPRLLINATDLQSGRRFIFCDETFNELNSDLSKYPMAYAVAASAAVPVVLHPVTLRDFSTIFHEYRHLIDGGVSDNLGIQTLLDTYAGQMMSAGAAGRPDPFPNGAVFIVIDAHTRFNAELASQSDIGIFDSLKAALGLTSTQLLNRVSSANLSDTIVRSAPDDTTAREIRKQIRDLTQVGYIDARDRHGHRVQVIYLSLDQVNDLPNVPFASFSESLNSIATYFNISGQEAYHLYQAADLLVRDKFETRINTIVADLNREATTQPAP
ncbi:MAG TPA: patatin-like phospholipase family protein [Tepidisphaeraceae bacterium]